MRPVLIKDSTRRCVASASFFMLGRGGEKVNFLEKQTAYEQSVKYIFCPYGLGAYRLQ